MVDKSEIIKDVRELLNGFVGDGTEIGIKLKSPEFADVFLDGEYFNTLDIKNRKLISNVRKKVTHDGNFSVNIVISRDDLRERYEGYKGGELQLPATESEIADALLRARITDENQKYTITECTAYGEDISNYLCREDDLINKLNFLAKHLSEFDKEKHKLYRGAVKCRCSESFSVKELINISYNLEEAQIYYDVFSDEDLGKFYADNGMLDWLQNADEKIWKYLDYTRLGMDIRLKEKGVYIDEGYFNMGTDEFTEVYDGVTFPECFETDNYIFKLGISYTGEDGVEKCENLNLPASKETKQKVLNKLGATDFEKCKLVTVQSMERKIPQCVEGISQIGVLNSLAHRMRDLEKSGEIAKFKAILSAMPYQTLDEIAQYANKLADYELYDEISSAVEYAMKTVENSYGTILPKTLIKHFDFESYAGEMCLTDKISITEYGVLTIKENTQ